MSTFYDRLSFMNNSNKLTFGGILTAVFIFLLPFAVSKIILYGANNTKYFLTTGFVVVLGLYVSYLILKGENHVNFRSRWFLGILIITLGFFYLSAFWGVDPMRSLWSDTLRGTGLLFLTSLGLLAFLVSEILTKKDWWLVRWGIIASSSLFAFLTYFGQEGLDIIKTHGLTFGNSTFAGTYLLLSLFITSFELFRVESGSRQRKILSILAVVQLLSPILLRCKAFFLETLDIFSNPLHILGSSRASGATAILAILYLLGFTVIRRFGKNHKKYLYPIWIFGFLLAISISVGMLFVSGSFIQEKYIESATAARVIVWESGLEAVKERPFLGWGPENFRQAFESHFNNDLFLDQNIGEVWFDKAHNIIVDSLVTVGIIGTLLILILWFYFALVVFRAYKNNIIGFYEANLLGVLPLFHLLQLQTSFDTPSSYAFLAIILGYGLWLEKEMVYNIPQPGEDKSFIFGFNIQKGLAVLILVGVLFGGKKVLIDEFVRQRALAKIFQATNRDEQTMFIRKALDDKIDFESLRLSSNSMIKGSFSQIASARTDSERERIMNITKEQLDLYEEYYLKYLERVPTDYRARMNYAHLLLTKTILGENRTAEAKIIIADSYHLSPDNPLTYVLDSVAYLYGGDLEASEEKINAGVALNPEIAFSQQVLKYIQQQKEQFPKIGILKIENL